MSLLHEIRLVRRLKRRDERAFADLLRLYQHKVYNLVYRMLGDSAEAEDVSQEVFVTVFRSIDTFRGDSKLSTWIYRIAVNHCKNRLKYLARRSYKETESYEDGEQGAGIPATPGLQAEMDGPDVILEGLQLERLVQEAIATLDEEHRLLIVLRDVQELSYQEIVQITGLQEGTVKSRLHRARMAIKDRIGKRGG